MGISAAAIGSLVAGISSSVVAGAGAAAGAIGGGLSAAAGAAGAGLSALGGGSIAAGASAASSLVSGGLGLAGALSSPKPPALMMAPPVSAVPNPPKNNNPSFAALATPSNLTNFGAPNSGQRKTLLGQ